MGLPQLDPFYSDDFVANRETAILSLKSVTKDIVIEGYSNFQIEYLSFNPEKLTAKITINIPKLRIHASFQIQGKLLTLKLPGSGKFFTELGNSQFI